MEMLKGVGIAIAVVFGWWVAHLIEGTIQNKAYGAGYLVAEVGPMFITAGVLLAAYGALLMLKYR